MTPAQAFKRLGLKRKNSTQRDVKRAYAQLIKAHRPETEPELFQQIRAAYEIALGLAPESLPDTGVLDNINDDDEDTSENGIDNSQNIRIVFSDHHDAPSPINLDAFQNNLRSNAPFNPSQSPEFLQSQADQAALEAAVIEFNQTLETAAGIKLEYEKDAMLNAALAKLLKEPGWDRIDGRENAARDVGHAVIGCADDLTIQFLRAVQETFNFEQYENAGDWYRLSDTLESKIEPLRRWQVFQTKAQAKDSPEDILLNGASRFQFAKNWVFRKKPRWDLQQWLADIRLHNPQREVELDAPTVKRVDTWLTSDWEYAAVASGFIVWVFFSVLLDATFPAFKNIAGFATLVLGSVLSCVFFLSVFYYCRLGWRQLSRLVAAAGEPQYNEFGEPLEQSKLQRFVSKFAGAQGLLRGELIVFLGLVFLYPWLSYLGANSPAFSGLVIAALVLAAVWLALANWAQSALRTRFADLPFTAYGYFAFIFFGLLRLGAFLGDSYFVTGFAGGLLLLRSHLPGWLRFYRDGVSKLEVLGVHFNAARFTLRFSFFTIAAYGLILAGFFWGELQTDHPVLVSLGTLVIFAWLSLGVAQPSPPIRWWGYLIIALLMFFGLVFNSLIGWPAVTAAYTGLGVLAMAWFWGYGAFTQMREKT